MSWSIEMVVVTERSIEMVVVTEWSIEMVVVTEWSIEMVVVTEFGSHDNLSVFEPRSVSDVLDISQSFSVATFLHLQVTRRDNMDGIPNYMSWKVSCCLLAY